MITKYGTSHACRIDGIKLDSVITYPAHCSFIVSINYFGHFANLVACIKSPTRLNMEWANLETTLANDFRNLVINTVYHLTFVILGIDGLVWCYSITHTSDCRLHSRLCMQYFFQGLISSSHTIYRTWRLRTAQRTTCTDIRFHLNVICYLEHVCSSKLRHWL